MVTWDNYEEYIMMHTDGELTPEEETALLAFVAQHPELKSEMEAYSAVKLTPDTSLVFTNKETLLKTAPAGRVIGFPQWRKYSVAAGIALLIGLSFYKWQNTTTVINTVAVNDTIKQITTPQPTATQKQLTTPNAKTEIAINTPKANTEPRNTKQQQSTTAMPHHTAIVPSVTKQNNNYTIEKKEENIAVARTTEQVDRLPMEGNKMMAVGSEPELQSTNSVAYAVVADEPQQSKSFLDKLPIDELKKQGIESMAAAVASTYQHINTLKNNLNEKTLTIQVEKRKLILSF